MGEMAGVCQCPQQISVLVFYPGDEPGFQGKIYSRDLGGNADSTKCEEATPTSWLSAIPELKTLTPTESHSTIRIISREGSIKK